MRLSLLFWLTVFATIGQPLPRSCATTICVLVLAEFALSMALSMSGGHILDMV